ncbi:aquaporin-like protein [Elsinoe ampelina]|uniref:Aquaporin-like protein n=1 Tax=Elsinoe ampelina TaxID=302913 RepID=A0A6A6GI66_9PEZI|nr:aquaporin-like protein [Elsinoe ampelina]
MNVAPPSGGLHLPFVKTKPHATERRLRGFEWLPNKVRNHFIAMLGEFCGTFLFLFFAFSATQVANASSVGADTGDSGSLSQAPNASALLYISLAFGFSLAVNAWVFFRISGGLFNPAVTLGMCLIGAVKWSRGGLIFISQILGAMCSAAVVSALFPGDLNVSTTLGGGTSLAQGVFIEMFLTAMLLFTIFMLAAEKHKGTFLAPVGIGLALFIAELSGVFFTGGSLNPARSFGPCVVLRNFPDEHWIYWLGPALGACLAVAIYRLIKTLEYETANPGQDFNEKEAEVFQPDDNPVTAADVARPTVVIGNPDYVADQRGVRSSRDLEGQRLGSSGSSTVSPVTSRNPPRVDGASTDQRPTAPVPARKPTPSDRFQAATEVEEGTMGGNYKVSGL